MRTPDASELAQWHKGSIMEHLGITICEFGDDWLRGQMPVDARTHQIHGVLHGGASVVLAETLGSLGAHLSVPAGKFRCVGIEVNANHMRSVQQGLVTGTARALHLGRTTHVWQTQIVDDAQRLICISRLTVAVVPM